MSDLRGRPDPGPRCDPTDVEIWEQLQRALTKLDQAEERAAVNESRFRSCCLRAEQAEVQLKQAKKERDEAKVKLRSELERKLASMESMAVQRDTLAEALRRIVAWDDAEKPHKNLPLLDCAELARRTLDALDQTNREEIRCAIYPFHPGL